MSRSDSRPPACAARSASASLRLSLGALALLAACGSDPAAPECTVSAVNVTPPTASVTVGATSQLAATVTASNCATTPSASWSTSDGGVASVSGSGLVTAVAPGTAVITATADGRTGQATVTVTPVPVASVAASVSDSSLFPGDTLTAMATVRDAADNVLTRAVTWSSGTPTVASIDAATGRITAVAPGTTVITATSEGRSGSFTLTVLARVASVTVFFSANPRLIGESANATVVVRDAGGSVLTGRPVRWSSDNAAIATVDSATGVVTAVAPGTVAIRATVEAVIGSATLLVLPAAESARFAFAWASERAVPIDVPYAADANYAQNAAGGGVTITRTAVGRYTVRFERMGKLGFQDGKRETVLASAYGSDAHYCSVLQFGDAGGADLTVEVGCHAFDGTDANAQFTVAVIGSNTLEGSYGFGWNDQFGGGLNALYTFASAEGNSGASQSALGRYTVDFPIAGLTRSTVITTATSAQRYCHPTSWGASTGTIAVRCLNGNGSSDADARFTALMTSSGRPGKRWGFVWNDQPATAVNVPYVPSRIYREQSNGGETSIRRIADGLYQVRFAGLGVATNRETVLVSTYGSGSQAPCQVGGWSANGGDLLVTVSCWSFTGGTRVNSSFSLLVLE